MTQQRNIFYSAQQLVHYMVMGPSCFRLASAQDGRGWRGRGEADPRDRGEVLPGGRAGRHGRQDQRGAPGQGEDPAAGAQLPVQVVHHPIHTLSRELGVGASLARVVRHEGPWALFKGNGAQMVRGAGLQPPGQDLPLRRPPVHHLRGVQARPAQARAEGAGRQGPHHEVRGRQPGGPRCWWVPR